MRSAAFISGTYETCIVAARVEEFRDESRPSCLMRCADASTGVAVKVLVEEHEVSEVRIAGQLGVISEDGPFTVFVFEEKSSKPTGELIRHLGKRQVRSRTGGALDLKIVAVVVVKFLQ